MSVTTEHFDPDAIKARADAATEGPWNCRSEPSMDGWNQTTIRGLRPGILLHSRLRYADAEFITHARTDVPALLAEVKRLSAENEVLRAALVQQAGDALEDIEHWAGYAGEYFAQKWDLQGCLDMWRARAAISD